ncbi:MAG: hypothetical protein ABWX92_09525, partial [Mycetocola sp.]
MSLTVARARSRRSNGAPEWVSEAPGGPQGTAGVYSGALTTALPGWGRIRLAVQAGSAVPPRSRVGPLLA